MDVLAAITLVKAAFEVVDTFKQGFAAIRAGATPEEQTMLDELYVDLQARNRATADQLRLFPNDKE